MMGGPRHPYDQDDDLYLTKYIATYNPGKTGRMGNALYKQLVEDAEGKWGWSKRHSWQSWRQHYKDNQYRFDAAIRKYQRKKGIHPGGVGAEEVAEPNGGEKENGRKSSSVSKMGNEKAEAHAQLSSSDQSPRISKHLSTQTAPRKNPTFKSYSKAEEEDNMSDESFPGRQDAASRGHKHVARKTARKTAVLPRHPEAEEEEDMRNEMASSHENATHRKRKSVDESDADGEAKRRRIHDEARNAMGNGKPFERSQNGNNLDHDRAEVEMSEDLNLNHNASHQKSSPPELQRPSSVVSRCLGLLSALNGLGDDKTQAAVFKALQLNADEQKEVLECAKSRLPQAGSSAAKNEHAEGYKRLYPHLSEDDNPGDASFKNAIPGAWGDGHGPDHPIETLMSHLPASESSGHVETRDKHISLRSSVSNNTSSPRPRHRVSNVKTADDFFDTPPPFPEKPSVAQPSPTTSLTSKAQDSRRDIVPDAYSPLPKRDPPRFASGTLTNSFVPSNGRRVLSRKRRPDLDSESDTEVIPSDLESAHGTKKLRSPIKSWPPLRKKKSTEYDIQPVPPEAGPSRLHAPIFPSASDEKSDKAKTIHAWRLETPLSEGQTPSVSLTTMSDPFLTIDHANRLRRQEKAKSKETDGKSKERASANVDAKTDRRMTFGGFSTSGPPEFDLRRKALRSSIAGNPTILHAPRSFSSSGSSTKVKEQERIPNTSRRASVATTVDLTLDFPSPGVKISPTDQVLIDRAGLQFFIQSMAQNHGVNEDWVRRVYEERRDLQGTDRIIAKMRDAAERAFEEAIEREKEGEEKVEDAAASTSKGPSANHQPTTGPSAQSSPNGREVDLSTSAPRSLSIVNRHRTELLYTPADEDSTLVRVRNQYAPPSASRAARYVRARARRSSGMTGSPLNPNAEGLRVDEDENSEKEEEEVTMTLTPSHMLVDSADSSASEHTERDIPSSPPASTLTEPRDGAKNSTEIVVQDLEDPMNPQPWTAEEDRILHIGEDEEAIQAIVERRGQLAVKWRLVELNDDDLMS